MRDHITANVHVAVAVVDLHIAHAQSLKDKRSVVTRAVAAVKNTLGASVAEVGGQDLWQRAVLGIAICAPTPGSVERSVNQIAALIEKDHRVSVLRVVPTFDTITYP